MQSPLPNMQEVNIFLSIETIIKGLIKKNKLNMFIAHKQLVLKLLSSKS